MPCRRDAPLAPSPLVGEGGGEGARAQHAGVGGTEGARFTRERAFVGDSAYRGGMKPRDAFLRELAERAGEPKRLGRSRSMFELGDGEAFVYLRYSKVHPKGQTFYGLRDDDLRELAGRTAFVALLWDGQDEPLLLPLSEFGPLFDEAGPAADGQVKAQVYLRDDQPPELYVARAGRHHVESYIGWEHLLSALADARDETPKLEHEQVQTLLGAIGDARGLDVWIPPNDRQKMDWTLAPRFPFRAALPPGLAALLREIDVVWLARGGTTPVNLYEVEHSTPIYSGLLRFNDVHLSVKERAPFAIVAEEERRALFARQLRRPTFQASGLDRLCGFMTYGEVFRWHERTPREREGMWT